MERPKRPPSADAAPTESRLSSTPSDILTLEEAAALAKCGIACMRALVDAGEVPAARLNRKHTVLLREDVIDFLHTKARQQAEERRKARELKPRLVRTPKPNLDRYG